MAPTESWAAVVLAAGRGERLGGVAKPLIQIEGETLLQRLLRNLRWAGVVDVVCVASDLGQALQASVASLPAMPSLHWVQVAGGLSPAHSLRQGLAALQHHAGAVMVCLADQPLIAMEDLQALMHAYDARPDTCDMVVPWVQDQPGNPVVITSALAHQWGGSLQQGNEQPVGKAWREQHPERVHFWHTPNTHYVADLDAPEDVVALRAQGWRIEMPQSG